MNNPEFEPVRRKPSLMILTELSQLTLKDPAILEVVIEFETFCLEQEIPYYGD